MITWTIMFTSVSHNATYKTHCTYSHYHVCLSVLWRREHVYLHVKVCVCKASLCVAACCFHISIIGWELRGLSSLYWSPNARVCATAACGMISSPWSSHLMTITVAFVHRGSVAFAWVFRVSKCYRLIFTPHATDKHKRWSFELQIGIKKNAWFRQWLWCRWK